MKKIILCFIFLFLGFSSILFAYFDPEDVSFGEFVLKLYKNIRTQEIPAAEKHWRNSLFRKFSSKGGVINEYVLTDQVCTLKIPVYAKKGNPNFYWALYRRDFGFSINLESKKVIPWGDLYGDIMLPPSRNFFILREKVDRKEGTSKLLIKQNNEIRWQEFLFSGRNYPSESPFGYFCLKMPKLEIHRVDPEDENWMNQNQAKHESDKEEIEKKFSQMELPKDIKEKIQGKLNQEKNPAQEDETFYLTNYTCDLSIPVYQDIKDSKRFLIFAGSNLPIQIIDFKNEVIGGVLPVFFHVSPKGEEVISIISGYDMQRSGGMAVPEGTNHDDVDDHVDDSCYKFQGLTVHWNDNL
jgi:hypothetical protein